MTVELTCSECGATKPADDFPVRRSAATGHRGQCIDCYRHICRDQERTRQRQLQLRVRQDNATLPTNVPSDTWIVEREEWQQQGACRGDDAELFFPPQGGDTRPAKAICRACPVQFQCLEYAIRTHQKFGIWGGKSSRERKVIRSQRRRQGAVA